MHGSLTSVLNGDVATAHSFVTELESGKYLQRVANVANYPDDLHFRWYLDAFDENIHEVIVGIARTLLNYEISLSTLDRQSEEDILKHLYQGFFGQGM